MIDLSALGTIRADGSILIDNTNVAYREAMTGDYKRVRQTSDVRYELGKLGYTSVLSSFISAVGVFGDNIRIRFHNGSVYEYYGFADKFDAMMRSSSKGQYFIKNIRPTKKYSKIASIDITPSTVMEDNVMFDAMETQSMARTVSQLQGSVIYTKIIKINGIEHIMFNIDGLIYYRPTSQ